MHPCSGSFRVTATGNETWSEIARALEEHFWPHIAGGRIRPVIHQTFPLREAAAAHALMDSSAHIGKIILAVARGQ